MSAAHFAVNSFVALFALIDPVGNTPLFAAATIGASAAGRRLTAAYISLFSFVFLAFFFLTGLALLRFFGISLGAFRIAGGALLFLLGLDMARGDLAKTLGEAADDPAQISATTYARSRFERLVVPIAVPLLVGPGAISTAVIYAGATGRVGLAVKAVGLAVIAAVSLSILASFWFSDLVNRLLGRVGMIVVVRVLGLILCAMAVQSVLTGLSDATVGVIRPQGAEPRPF
jgi:multiple antibiotic resistance protein